jgi:hypothetical protein
MPEPSADLVHLQQLQHLAALLAEANQVLARLLGNGPAESVPLPRQLVSLDQAAAMVHRVSTSLYRYKERGMPAAVNRPTRGQSLLYDWAELRPWLQEMFGLLLPEIYPSHAAGR